MTTTSSTTSENSEPSTRNMRSVWLWRIFILAITATLFALYGSILNNYEIGITLIAATAITLVGQNWLGFRIYAFVVLVLSLLGVYLYGHNLSNAHSEFFLNYILASQSAIMWMSAFFVMATVTYFAGNLLHSPFTEKVATGLTWSAVTMGMVGLMVRWRESYLLGADIGHIPISNLYEVFILFSLVTSLLYLFYENKTKTRSLGGFVLLVVSAAVAFQLWYSFGSRDASHIEPLVPALQSYWMKMHVPANFIGYGSFSAAAMIGVAYLLVSWRERVNPTSRWVASMPSLAMMDNLMYRLISLGFAFFTLATILGSLWASEAWGGFWSWDPKETWALIVWLNYAAWLHLRMTKGWSGRPMAWWSVIGLLITVFAFLGVNMFLSGLHSYGKL